MQNHSFIKSNESVGVNISFQEFADATGIVYLYGADDQDGNGFLTPSTTIPSATIQKKVSMTSSYTKLIDMDFDVLLNKPLNLKGNMIISSPVKTDVSTGSNAGYSYTIVRLRKWDGTTETELFSGTSVVVIRDGNAVYDGEMLSIVKIPVTLTSLKVGETLRITIEVWGKYSGSPSTHNIFFGHDPLNRISINQSTNGGFASGEYTRLSVALPIVLEI